jgi:Xaa-Pro dipeptidase
MNGQRLTNVLKNLDDMGLEQALIVDPLSIKYLCGYFTRPMERFLGLYVARGSEPVLFCNNLFPDASACCDHVVTFFDTDDVISLVAATIDHEKPLGVDKDLAARWLIPLMDAHAASGFVLASKAVDDARTVKDAHEVDLMRRASAINDEAMGWLVEQLHEGVTEHDIASRLDDRYRELGAQGNSFAPIVSFGANASDPHHEPDDTALAKGDVVLFDVGCQADDYVSDMTRTFFFGAKPSERDREVFELVAKANATAEAMIAPGVTFAQIDAAARDVIDAAGYGPDFNHRLGHQVGLSVHEPGDVSATHDEAVRPGQCFSIEPGIYLTGEMGVRIEDLVCVTEDGCEVLNHYPHDLRVLA